MILDLILLLQDHLVFKVCLDLHQSYLGRSKRGTGKMSEAGGLLETKLDFYRGTDCMEALLSAVLELKPDLGILEIRKSREELM